jgi:glycosyltransferase involved in cell wall biosynthesis
MIAVLFHRLGPYHQARLRAASALMPLVAVQGCTMDRTYAWAHVEGDPGFPVETLFDDGDSDDRGSGEVMTRIASVLDRVQPKVVVIPGWSANIALCALTWCRENQVPAVVMSDSTAWDLERRPWWREAIKRRLLRGFSSALVAGTPHADYISQLGMPEDRIYLGYDAVDNAYFAAAAAKCRCFGVSEGGVSVSQTRPYFLASNRFIEKKNLFRLLDAYGGYVNRDQRPETRDKRQETRDKNEEEGHGQLGRVLHEEEGHGQLGRVLHEEEGHGQLGRVLHEEEGHGQLGRVLHEEVTGGPPVPLLLHGHSAQAQPTSDLRPPTSDLWPLVLLGDGELKPQLLAHCTKLGLHVIEAAPWDSDRNTDAPKHRPTVFFPGFRQIGELPRFYAHAGAFVHASTTEQWGLVVNEAMACGLPVIVSNRVGCAQDLVQDGVNGYTFDPYDVEQLAQLMHRLTEAPKHSLSEMGDASRTIIADWGPERFASGLKQALDCALKVGPKRASLLQRLLLKALLWR